MFFGVARVTLKALCGGQGLSPRTLNWPPRICDTTLSGTDDSQRDSRESICTNPSQFKSLFVKRVRPICANHATTTKFAPKLQVLIYWTAIALRNGQFSPTTLLDAHAWPSYRAEALEHSIPGIPLLGQGEQGVSQTVGGGASSHCLFLGKSLILSRTLSGVSSWPW